MTSSRTATAGIGILVVVVATAVRAFFAVVGMLISAGVMDENGLAPLSPVPVYPLDSAAGIVSMLLLAGVLAMSLASIWGLVRRRSWGWTLAIVTSGLMLTLSLGWWAAGEPHYLSMFINSVAVFYLNQRDLRAVFGIGRGD